MKSAFKVLGGGLIVLSLTGCGEKLGYAEIKTSTALPLRALSLSSGRYSWLDLVWSTVYGDVQFEKKKTGVGTVLRVPAGPARLRVERNGRSVAFCEFEVISGRVVSVTVFNVGRNLDCTIEK